MKITNIKVGVEFDRLLSGHPVFAGDGYKLISPCHHFLQEIYRLAVPREGELVGYHSEAIKTIFRSFTKGKYKPFLDALEELKLLEVKRCYYHCPTNPTKSRCNKYKVLDLGKHLLEDEEVAYLRNLHNDPQIRRRNLQNRSKRNRKVVLTGDVAVDSTTKMLWDLKLDRAKLATIMASHQFDDGERDSIRHSLLRFERGDFDGVERNAKDGRIHHPWVLMKSEIRGAFYLKDEKIRTHTLDIRACHPVFWAKYVFDFYKRTYKPVKESGLPVGDSVTNHPSGNYPNLPSLPISPHYVGIDGDILANEKDRWIAFWTDENNDPREIIAQELGFTKDMVKASINSALNGSRNRLGEWLAATYPHLFMIWVSMEVKLTGNEIAKQFETDIMLNPDFFHLAKGLGVRIMPEHDGVSVFASLNDGELKSKLEKMGEFLKDYSTKKFGVPIVVKIEDTLSLN